MLSVAVGETLAPLSTALAAGTATLIGTTSVAINSDTAGIQVQWSEAVGDDFSRNLIRARCEDRFDVSVFQPFGVAKITLPRVHPGRGVTITGR
ncbi:MAG: hypothetical protein ACR2P2_18930 [Nakamurella sp.]